MRKIDVSKRLRALPPYLFAQIDRKKTALRRKKIAFIDLSIGDPDIPSPNFVVALHCMIFTAVFVLSPAFALGR